MSFCGVKWSITRKTRSLSNTLAATHRPEGLDGERSGDVVGEHAGKMAVDDLPGFTDFFIRVGLKDFLGKSMRHGTAPEGKRFPDRRAKTPFCVSSSIGIVTTFFRPKDQRPADRFSPGNRGCAGKARRCPSARLRGGSRRNGPLWLSPRLRASVARIDGRFAGGFLRAEGVAFL